MNALGGKLGHGARYRMDRWVSDGLPVYVTVLAPQGPHALVMNEQHAANKPIAVVVRLVKLPDEKWKGFLTFEKRPVPRPWCFVVESILTAVSTGT